jgi:hypothetical protein
VIEVFAGSQVLVLSGVLIAACLSKLAIRESFAAADPEGPGGSTAVALRDSRPLTVGLALAEGALGVALLVTAHPSVRLAAIMGFASATWVVSELRTHRPEGGCGCFGALSTHRVGARAVVRAALFTGAATATLGFPGTGLDAFREKTILMGIMLLAEVVLIVALSPEIDVLLGRLRTPVPCELRTASLSETHDALRAHHLWREHQDMLTSTTPIDVWRELCWRLLAYPGRLNGEEVEIVFAVSLEERRPVVRTAVLVPEATAAPADGRGTSGTDPDVTDSGDDPDSGGVTDSEDEGGGPSPFAAISF